MNILIKKNDVIQVNENIPDWCGCLMIVEEVKDWGVMAGMRIPFKGSTYLRLKFEDIEYIGESVFVPLEEEE